MLPMFNRLGANLGFSNQWLAEISNGIQDKQAYIKCVLRFYYQLHDNVSFVNMRIVSSIITLDLQVPVAIHNNFGKCSKYLPVALVTRNQCTTTSMNLLRIHIISTALKTATFALGLVSPFLFD